MPASSCRPEPRLSPGVPSRASLVHPPLWAQAEAWPGSITSYSTTHFLFF